MENLYDKISQELGIKNEVTTFHKLSYFKYDSEMREGFSFLTYAGSDENSTSLIAGHMNKIKILQKNSGDDRLIEN